MSSSVSNTDNHNKTKSVGTQHDASNAYDPWVRQTDSKSKSNTAKSSVLTQKLANSNAKVIVITDDFKKKALNQEVFVDTKRKMLRYMKSNKLTNSSRSMNDDNEPDETTKVEHKQKAISKSVDNVSQLSTELDPNAVGSVELIFISDEFLNKVAKPDVIILKNNSKQMSEYASRKSKLSSLAKTNGSNYNSHANENGQSSNVKKVSTDDIRRKSKYTVSQMTDIQLSNNGNILNDDATVNGTPDKHGKLNRQSSGETSIDDVNNKLTSHAFQSYDEQEHLESKEIQSPTTEDIPT